MTVDPLEYRQVMGAFATGVTIVTTAHEGIPYGMTANSVTSVSLEPVLLLVCFMKGSKTGIATKEHGWFALNILAADQEDLSRRFAFPDADFEGMPYDTVQGDLPLLKGCLGWIACRVKDVSDAGDHYIVLGEVTDHGGAEEGDPLLFYQGKYRRILPKDGARHPQLGG